ncbi:hypothetical protein ACWDGI_30430 [Streptomyces sp. NPDC001220]
MAAPYVKWNRWPMWQFVRETLSRQGLDADKLIDSLPQVGPPPGMGVSYGLAWYSRPGYIGDAERVALTVAAAPHVPSLLPVMAHPFLNVLRKLVEIYRAAPLDPDSVVQVAYTAEMIRQALPSISDQFMERLPGILDHEPPTWFGSKSGANGEWARGLKHGISRYDGVRFVKSYVVRVTELMPPPIDLPTSFAGDSEPEAMSAFASQPPAPVYVKEPLIKELEDKNTSSQWDVTKLVQLTRELNSNFALDNPYACHALIRAILDHTAPVFGQKSFEQVASNSLAAWTKTDKDYLRKLLDFKPQGHDALHRHIRKSADLIDMHDVPSSAWLNAFLRLVIDAL